MSKYNAEKFNYSRMSERIQFMTQNADGTYTNSSPLWAFVSKDGFTRSENDNWFRLLVREQSSLAKYLARGNRIKWKKTTLEIFSWQDPSYEQRGFIEIMTKQINTLTGENPGPSEGDLFRDIVSVYEVTVVEKPSFGIISYEYQYDFTAPQYTGIRCSFSTDRNKYLDDKNIDVEHDAMVVLFSVDAPIKIEDYIESPVHGRFKIDMIVKNRDNMLEASCQRSEVQ